MEWVSRIKEALEKDLFELWMQPIVPVGNPSAQGEHMEVLLRMQGGEAGIISPGSFIPAAERFGLMTELDRWVVRQTLDCLDKNISSLPALKFCCINLPAHPLRMRNFWISCWNSLMFTRISSAGSVWKLPRLLPSQTCRALHSSCASLKMQGAVSRWMTLAVACHLLPILKIYLLIFSRLTVTLFAIWPTTK